jgi:hypothetical protein
MANYEFEYISMLEIAHNFLFRKAKPVNGTPLNQARHEFVIISGGCCLHCGKRLTISNSNTEHIHDRALGGHNIAHNKVIMCSACNLARNKTMQIYVGTPSYWRGFPGNWDRIKNYLLWNAVTVDKGHEYGKFFPEVHNIFESIISERNRSFTPPNIWYGRGDKTSVIRVHTKKSPGLLIRFFDKIFGYQAAEISSSQNNLVISTNGIEITQSNNVVKAERKILELDDSFFEQILSALGSIEGEIKLETFASYFQLFLIGQGLPKQSLKDFANSYGIPKRRTFVEIIEDYFSDKIDYRREGQHTVYISKKIRDVFECHPNEEE